MCALGPVHVPEDIERCSKGGFWHNQAQTRYFSHHSYKMRVSTHISARQSQMSSTLQELPHPVKASLSPGPFNPHGTNVQIFKYKTDL